MILLTTQGGEMLPFVLARSRFTVRFNIQFLIYSEGKSQPRSGNRPRYEEDIPGRLSQTFGLCARLLPQHICATGFFVFSYSELPLLLWRGRQDTLAEASLLKPTACGSNSFSSTVLL